MGTKQFDSATDLITFGRASGGTALRKISYGSELVTNGTFDGDIDDFTSTGTATVTYDATEGAAKVNVTGSGGGIADDQTITVTSGKVYLVSVTLKKTTFSGDLHIQVEGTNVADFTPTTSYQTFTASVVAGDSDLTVAVVRKNSPTGIFFVSNISVKEVLFDQVDGTLTLFNHPDDIPRIEYNTDDTVKGLLIEEQRTNVVTYSEDTSTWTEDGTATITNSTQIAPDGTASATLVDIGSTGTNLGPNRISRFSSDLSASTKVTVSVFLKKPDSDAASYVNVRLFCAGTTATDSYVDYDTSDFTSVNSSGGVDTVHASEDYGNGWFRVSFTTTLDASATGSNNIRVGGVVSGSHPATGTDFIMWGAQVETGSFPTSYIPTTGSTATRSADIASIPVTDFGYNQKAGSVVVDVDYYNTGSINASVLIGNQNDRYFLYYSGGWKYQVKDGGSTVAQLSGSAGSLNDVIAIAWKENDFIIQDGSGSDTDTSGTLPSTANLDLYLTGTFGFASSGHIKSIQYYPRRLTNAQLQEITS